MRIVIADDDMLVSGALRTILEKDQDIEVQGIASNGKEAKNCNAFCINKK